MVSEANENSNNGRDAKGRFVKGNPGGTGNPIAKKMAAYRRAIFDGELDHGLAVKHVLWKMARKAAEKGDVAAARVYLEYVVGKPRDIDLEERLDAIEGKLRDEPDWRIGDEQDRASMIRGMLSELEDGLSG